MKPLPLVNWDHNEDSIIKALERKWGQLINQLEPCAEVPGGQSEVSSWVRLPEAHLPKNTSLRRLCMTLYFLGDAQTASRQLATSSRGNEKVKLRRLSWNCRNAGCHMTVNGHRLLQYRFTDLNYVHHEYNLHEMDN